MKNYIVIDTNAWIYLCNGFNLDKNLLKEGHHIKIFKTLKRLSDNGNVVVLINKIIKEEFIRNKEQANGYIKKIKANIQDNNNQIRSKGLRNNTEKRLRLVKENIILEERIKVNEEHIKEVETFLLNDAIVYPKTFESQALGVTYAISKKAPFNKNTNSMADFIILVDGIFYIKKNYSTRDPFGSSTYYHPSNYFISANTRDFSSKQNKDEIHQDLKHLLGLTNMKYVTNLGTVINKISGDYELNEQDIQDYLDYIEGGYAPCPICYNDYAYISFDYKIKIRDNSRPLYDDKQLRFSFVKESTQELNKGAYFDTYEGNCNNCWKPFFICQCEEILHYQIDDTIECESCGSIYEIKNRTLKNGECVVEYFLLEELDLPDDDF